MANAPDREPNPTSRRQVGKQQASKIAAAGPNAGEAKSNRAGTFTVSPTRTSTSADQTATLGASTPTTVGAKVPPSGHDRIAAAAASLLKLESEARKARSLNELAYFIANEPRSVTRAQQIVLLERSASGRLSVRTVSSATHIDRSSPLVLWFEAITAALEHDSGLLKSQEFEAGAYSTDLNGVRDAYPMRHLLWVPLIDLHGAVLGGMLQARSTPWTEHEIAISNHIAASFAMNWQALSPRNTRFNLPTRMTLRSGAIAGIAIATLALFPVSMSALAPVEVAPRDPFIVTTGVEGVIDKVLVEPNAFVTKGQLLVQMAETVLKNRLEIAAREVAVAQTKYKKAAQLAFVDVRGRHELALAQAEFELKTAERDYARDLFERTLVRADRDGVVLFSDKKDLIGRPVAIGEKLMELATPGSTQFHVDLGVADAIVLRDGARIKVFLDSAPLSPFEAKLIRADYQARPRDSQQMAFRLVAEITELTGTTPQLGVRGTAQVYGDTVLLGYYLLRRPIAAARQWIGL